MKVLVVGGGGREHAIVKALKTNSEINKLYCAPGNGGIAKDATCVDIKATNIEEIANWAKDNSMDYVVVAPDDPLCLGLCDLLSSYGIASFGPTKEAAKIEGSKAFAKKLMTSNNIPTAKYEEFIDCQRAINYINSCNEYPLVVKADGLALGKGVIICNSQQEATDAVIDMMENNKFGLSGNKIIIEEFLEGPEVTVLSFTDGKTIVPTVSSMDHKRALDNDEGLNTGGMGVIAPNPHYTNEVANQCMQEIFLPTINALNSMNTPFKGCLYFGLILTKNGPKVIEYNCRFGDPETQAILPLLKTDLFTIMKAITTQTLSQLKIEFSSKSSCCVMLASGGYPVEYKKNYKISGIDLAEKTENISICHSGTTLNDDNSFYTNGGRVVSVTAVEDTLESAIQNAYNSASQISFTDMHFRTDIGKKALSK